MTTVTRLQVGLFGCLFHVLAASLFAAKAARSAGSDLGALYGPSVAAAVAAFLVYAVIVTPYARKRYGTTKRGIVLFDFLIGMLAEVAVLAVGSILWAIATSGGALASGIGAYLVQVGSASVLAFLWAVGTAMTEVLAIGNGAGFVGYLVLKKLAARRAAAGAGPG